MAPRPPKRFEDIISELYEKAERLSPREQARLLSVAEADIAEVRGELASSRTGAERESNVRNLYQLIVYRQFLVTVLETAATIPPRRPGPEGIRPLILELMRASGGRRWSPRDVHEAIPEEVALPDGATSPPTLHSVQVAMQRMAKSGELDRVGHGRYVRPAATPKKRRTVTRERR